jgi:SAM-dependent methyltransferase
VSREPYDPKAYWARLHEDGSLRSVGQSSLPVALNEWLYRIGRRNVVRFVRRHGLFDPPPQRVFDAGSGTGYWVALWGALGATEIDGCDLVESAVDRLRATFPGQFTVGDIAEAGVIPDDHRYDLVTAFNVLLHILDDERFEAAVRNLAGAVAPGGSILLAEPVLTRSAEWELRPGASSRARRLERYERALSPAGLTLVDIAPTTVVGANPIERDHRRFRLYDSLWTRTTRFARTGPRRARAAGRALDLLDRALIHTPDGPSGKFMLFRRRA